MRRSACLPSLVLLLAIPAPANAQFSATATLTSQLSVRGVALGDGRPGAQLAINYDGSSGWYGGAMATPEVRVGDRNHATELLAFGGYAQRLASGLSWEAGANSISFVRGADYNYQEAYAGVSGDRLGVRVFFAPHYYGYGGRIAYTDVNGFTPLADHLRLVAHAGVLHPLQGSANDRVDLRLALAYDAGPCALQLAWLHSSGQRAPRALALSAAWSW
ncbi:MAG: TorF family putative porin [Massilia sp.]